MSREVTGTRNRIVQFLRKRASTVEDLAKELAVTENAIRAPEGGPRRTCGRSKERTQAGGDVRRHPGGGFVFLQGVSPGACRHCA